MTISVSVQFNGGFFHDIIKVVDKFGEPDEEVFVQTTNVLYPAQSFDTIPPGR